MVNLDTPVDELVQSNITTPENEERVDDAASIQQAEFTRLPASCLASNSIDQNLDLSVRSLEGGRSQDSLEALTQNTQQINTGFPAAEHEQAASTALPESIRGLDSPGSYTDESVRWDSPRISRQHPTFRTQDVISLAAYLPHLKNIFVKPRGGKDSAHLEYYDFYDNDTPHVRRYSCRGNLQDARDEFTEVLINNRPPDLQLRLLVVEDLSVVLIRVLGSCLGINPEFFGEHLLNSGWHENSYTDPESDTWNTRDFIKDYISIKWYRPTKGRVRRPCWEAGHESSLKLDSTQTPQYWDEGLTKAKTVNHTTSALVNILRRFWETNLDSESFSAWEERATVWQTQLGACNFVVLLLDPLPMVRHRADLQIIKAHAQKLTHQPPRTRQADGESDMVPHAEPSASQANVQDTENAEGIYGDQRKSFISRVLSNFYLPWKGHAKKKADLEPQEERWQASVAEHPQESEATNSKDSDHCIFIGQLPRLPLMDYQRMATLRPEDEHLLDLHFSKTVSTEDTFWQILRFSGSSGLFPAKRVGPMDALFMIILSDTLTILGSMDAALTAISLVMLDESILQSRVDNWRRIHNQFEGELRRIELSLHRFAGFGKESGKRKAIYDKIWGNANWSKATFAKCLSQISSVRQRTQRSQKALMTTMSLVESKRGIAEAESVTKLTELAFLFIPLTFSASVFSMQVKELNASTVSVSDFFIVALSITALSYALRLFIRSPAVLRYWRLLGDDIRASTETPKGSPVKTSSFFIWLWNRTGRPEYPVYVIALTIAVLAGMWSRPLQQNMRFGVVAVFGVIGLALLLRVSLLRMTSVKWRRRLAR